MTQPNKQKKKNQTEKKSKKKSELKNNDLTNQNPSKKLLHATAAIFQKKRYLIVLTSDSVLLLYPSHADRKYIRTTLFVDT